MSQKVTVLLQLTFLLENQDCLLCVSEYSMTKKTTAWYPKISSHVQEYITLDMFFLFYLQYLYINLASFCLMMRIIVLNIDIILIHIALVSSLHQAYFVTWILLLLQFALVFHYGSKNTCRKAAK